MVISAQRSPQPHRALSSARERVPAGRPCRRESLNAEGSNGSNACPVNMAVSRRKKWGFGILPGLRCFFRPQMECSREFYTSLPCLSCFFFCFRGAHNSIKTEFYNDLQFGH